MALKIGRTPILAARTTNAADLVRSLYHELSEIRGRLIEMLPKDGQEPMENPLPFQQVATGSLPAAASWEGGVVYDATTNSLKYSDGANWLEVADSSDLTAALDDVMLLDGSQPMENPLPLEINTFGSIPTASSWEGAILYNEDLQMPGWSNGTDWLYANGADVDGGTVSNVAALEIGLPAGFTWYKISLINYIPATDGANLLLRTSSNGGSSFDSGASDYAHTEHFFDRTFAGADSHGVFGDEANSEISLGGGYGNTNNSASHLEVWLFDPGNAALRKTIGAWSFKYGSAPAVEHNLIMGQRLSTADIDAVQFTSSSGNLSTSWKLTVWV